METEITFRLINSLLVLISLPALIYLTCDVLKTYQEQGSYDAVQLILLIIYILFLVSGLMTLYINIQVLFYHAQPGHYTLVALWRNIIKQLGIAFVSWRLYFITQEGGRKNG